MKSTTMSMLIAIDWIILQQNSNLQFGFQSRLQFEITIQGTIFFIKLYLFSGSHTHTRRIISDVRTKNGPTEGHVIISLQTNKIITRVKSHTDFSQIFNSCPLTHNGFFYAPAENRRLSECRKPFSTTWKANFIIISRIGLCNVGIVAELSIEK